MSHMYPLLLLTVTAFYAVAALGIDSGQGYVGPRRVRRQSSGVHGDCPNLGFPCGNSTQCISQDEHCDGRVDCDNGADENEDDCDDEDQTNNFDFLFGFKDESDEDYGPPPPSCNGTVYPEACECFVVLDEEDEGAEPLGLSLECILADLEAVPDDLPPDTIYLDLGGNRITEVGAETFENLPKLQRLSLQHNLLTGFEPGTFDGLPDLEILDLSNNDLPELRKEYFWNLTRLRELLVKHNPIRRLDDADLFLNLRRLEILSFAGAKITQLRTGVFTPLRRLTKLVLAHNRIEALTQGNMAGLESLEFLDMQNNDITFIEAGAFADLASLQELRLHGNKLEEVTEGMFENLPSLRIILLDGNDIQAIEPGSFAKLSSLQHITMSDNKLSHLAVGVFEGLSRVTSLSLFDNDIETMENGTFAPLINVNSLNLEDNPFRVIPRGIFDVMPKLGHIYFDHFFLCGFAPHVKDCNPKGDGLSNAEDLLGSIVLRVSVWMVSILAFFGNIVVLLARCISRDDNKVHSFFIINLALSDFLMGAYLFMIAVHDVIYRGVYIQHDLDWRSSWVCKLCGAFSLLSSEMSVFTLTVITADRYFCIVHPFRFRSRALLPAAVLMGTMWLLSISLAVFPVIHTAYFGDYFYGANGVCLPLQFDRPFDDGWVFSLFVFVIANLVSFAFIVWAYFRMFMTIRRSNHAARSTKVSQDYALLKRFTVIVATDFLCWMPIIIVKFVTYAGVQIPPAAHAWFAIFILPVNSALNPVLYTMTTRQFKRMLFHPTRAITGSTKTKTTAGPESQSAVSHSRGRLSVISHPNMTKNGTPTTPRNNRTEDIPAHTETIPMTEKSAQEGEATNTV